MGNTRSLLHGMGGVLNRAAWGAWGESFGVSVSSPFGYKGAVGQYRDSETGLLYLNARYYSPALGRFLSRDPIGFAGGINVYGYCGGDPVNFADADGLDGIPLISRLVDGARGYNYHLGPIPVFAPLETLIDLHDHATSWGTMEGQNDAKPGSVPAWDLWMARLGMGTKLGKAAMMLARPIAGAIEGGIGGEGVSGGGGAYEEPIQVRHHTDVEGLRGIQASGGFIWPTAGGGAGPGVYVEVSASTGRFGPLQGMFGPRQNFGSPEGAFVQFDAWASELKSDPMAQFGNGALIIGTEGGLNVSDRNPRYVIKRWWMWWVR